MIKLTKVARDEKVRYLLEKKSPYTFDDLVTVVRHAAGTDSPRQESQGAACAAASGCPRNRRVRISSAKTEIPREAGIATARVSPRADAAVRRSSVSPAFPFCRAADKAGTAERATEAVSEGSILNTGTAKVE